MTKTLDELKAELADKINCDHEWEFDAFSNHRARDILEFEVSCKHCGATGIIDETEPESIANILLSRGIPVTDIENEALNDLEDEIANIEAVIND